MNKNENRGGLRGGAGRPKGSKNTAPAAGRKTVFKTVSIALSEPEADLLKQLAEKAGLSVSSYVRRELLAPHSTDSG